MSSFDWELDKLTKKKNQYSNEAESFINTSEMDLETKGGRETREKESKERNDSLHLKCA